MDGRGGGDGQNDFRPGILTLKYKMRTLLIKTLKYVRT